MNLSPATSSDPAVLEHIQEASKALAGLIRHTPCEPSAWLSELTGADVHLKLENFQVTGSFKARGASNKLQRLTAADKAKGVVTASSGNHGLAVAYAAAKQQVKATVFVPETTPTSKRQAIENCGAELRVQGSDCVEAEASARARAEQLSCSYISPYNDMDVMAGQGTAGVELAKDCPPLDAVFVALGGGGLIAGMGEWLRHRWPHVTMVACSPERSPAMHRCLEAGRIIEVPCHATWSDATAGGVEAGAITFGHCQNNVGRSLLLSEQEIATATVGFIREHRMLIEGAAGTAIAGLMRDRERWKGKRVAVVICGANLGLDRLRGLLAAVD